MTCDEYRAGVLAGDATRQHADHLATCALCRAERASLETTAALLREPTLWQEPDAAVEERVVAAISGEAGATHAVPVRRQARMAITTAAAVIVLGVAGVVFALVGGSTAGPDWEVSIFAAGPNDADGTVQGWNSNAGTRVRLDALGLAPAPAGSVYELWFSAADVHVSAGTFREATDVDLWVGVSRRAFPRIWVTIEPLDGDPAPSGQTVLDTRR